MKEYSTMNERERLDDSYLIRLYEILMRDF